MERLDVVVVGAGVVGLAVARALSLRGREVVVIEAERSVGSHTSARNSEVIHAGIYYAADSLKARLCVLGKHALYAYCHERGVAHRNLGKVIVATREEERAELVRIDQHARRNGVTDLVFLSAAEVSALEPQVTARAGLWSPSTGIIDSHGLMTALRRDAEDNRASIVLATRVVSGRVRDDGIELCTGGDEPMRVSCRAVVNAAGLFAPAVAGSIEGLRAGSVPVASFAKGHYFVLSGPSPFSHLVYPVPVPGGLGIHVTLDLADQARFGPDVSWVDGVDYSFEAGRASAFAEAIRRYYPSLRDADLLPGYTGIRPKLGPARGPAQDFLVQGRETHGAAGLVNLFGIESPGLTASLALAELVADRLQD
jgi:L-2-hydroxyglutarate oxidase LhgO